MSSHSSAWPGWTSGRVSSQSSPQDKLLGACLSPSASISVNVQPNSASQESVVHSLSSPHLSVSPAAQRCVATSQLSRPVHSEPSSQSPSSSQLNVQSISQPSAATSLPSSHCSLPLTSLSPQPTGVQLPCRHCPSLTAALVQAVPSGSGSSSAQVWS